MSDGLSLYTQPENTRTQLRSGRWTSSWMNAPVSGAFSHGALVSHARSRTTASLMRSAWPGLSMMSRTMPLRLLSRPSTATRSAIGVTPGWSALARGTSIVTA